MLALINPYVAKIAIALKDGDSIRSVSKKIKESYGWTYKWILELEKVGALKREKQEVHINKNNRFYKDLHKFAVDSLNYDLNLDDAYLLPNLTGLDYIFINIDAVFIWTKGGYNIGRSKDSYPIFIEVLGKDKRSWEGFFTKLNLDYTFKNERKKGIYFAISATTIVEREYCDGIPVLPLAKTVEFAKKYIFNFEPALEMLKEMYNLKIKVVYAQK